MNPRISVLLPVYNGEAWLAPCIQSVLDQTFEEFELLAGDDGSRDGSREILASFRDPRLRVLRFDKNAGLFGNLNRLLKEARAPLVRFLCQDDLLESRCLAEEVSYFESHGEIALSICQVSVIDARGREIGEWKSGQDPIVMKPQRSLQMFHYHGCIAGNLSTVCVRRKCLDEVGGFDEDFQLAGDYEMWVRLCQRGALVDLQQKLVKMRAHSQRLSQAAHARVGFVRENRRVRGRLIPLLGEELRPYALRYCYWRQNVLETHCFVRCLIEGRFAECRELARIMGVRDLAGGLIAWLLTANNHLYRPKPVFHNS